MINDEFLFSRFAEPAIVFSYENRSITFEKINHKFLPELRMNMDEKEFLQNSSVGKLSETDTNTLFNTIEKCIATGEPTECELWFHMFSGCCGEEDICLRLTFSVLEEASGMHRIYASIRNITAEKSNIYTLIENNKLNNSIIEALSAVYSSIFLVDLNKNSSTIIKPDEAFPLQSDLDITYSDSIMQIVPMVEEEDAPVIALLADTKHMQEVVLNGYDTRDFTFKSKFGNVWIRSEYHVIERTNGIADKMLLTCTVIDDITSQKLDADRLISKQNAELEKREKQLLEAVEAANRANRAKSDFLAQMSHEIRTPMNAIMGMDEMIAKTASDPTIKSYANDAYRAATGLLGIINEILDFSKIESGKTEIICEKFNLGTMLSDLYTMFALRAEDKNLALVFDIDRNLPKLVNSDELHLRQILTNLLSNAVKYTEKGQITFKATVSGTSAISSTLHFEVTDTGQGISEADLNKLLVPFERLNEKENRNIEGTGLGMSIASKLIELLGSRLQISSVVQQGSTFSFDLPVTHSGYEPIGDFRKCLITEIIDQPHALFVNPDISVLVVDDNIVNIKVLQALLKATQVKVSSASSGKDALEKTTKAKYDIIFMDHYMPEMDGIETFAKLKEQTDGLNCDTPTVVLTANAIKGAYEEYLSYGFADVLFKPTTQQNLSSILWKILA